MTQPETMKIRLKFALPSPSAPTVHMDDVDPTLHRELTEDGKLTDYVFTHLILKRIVKENHGCDIHQIAFHPTSHLVVTLGGTQANVYDNRHVGDHLDIVSHFSDIDELLACCWIQLEEDALLIVAGAGKTIHVLSLAYSKELKVLQGHTGTITELKASPRDRDIVYSASADGTIRQWHIEQGCLAIFNAIHPNNVFIYGDANGSIQQLDLSLKTNSVLTSAFHDQSPIDCIRFVDTNILSKSYNGQLVLWNPTTLQVLHKMQIQGLPNACRFDVSFDSRYCCVGGSDGSVSVFNLETGSLVSRSLHKRSIKPINACAFSPDGLNILYVSNDTLIWRLDFLMPS